MLLKSSTENAKLNHGTPDPTIKDFARLRVTKNDQRTGASRPLSIEWSGRTWPSRSLYSTIADTGPKCDHFIGPAKTN